jgi:3-dehydroquinate synthase
MSDLKATVAETKRGFHVEGYEKIEYDFTFIDGIFDTNHSDLAECYKQWGRCLAVMDLNIFNVYGTAMQRYFEHYGLELEVHKTMIGEKAKSMDTLLSIVDSMTKFGIYRKVTSFHTQTLRILISFTGAGACSRRWTGD